MNLQEYFIYTVILFWENLQSLSFSHRTSDSWWSRQPLSFWPIKLTHICQLPMYHFLSVLQQQVINGPASSAQYDVGWLAVQHWDAWHKCSEQNCKCWPFGDRDANFVHFPQSNANLYFHFKYNFKEFLQHVICVMVTYITTYFICVYNNYI